MTKKSPGVDDNIVTFEPPADARTASTGPSAAPQPKGSTQESLRAVKAFMGLDDPDIRRLFIELMERVATVTQPDAVDTPRSPS
ncbi:hypothetical protein MXD81_49025 [Microbacteriaceae bacterium K1510]|nr:hypothetical protein [Microbacteriaceae bacterium K1510]